MKKIAAVVLTALSLSGCASEKTTLSPMTDARPSLSESAARIQCARRARAAEPRIQRSPAETWNVYLKVYDVFADCAAQYGYKAACAAPKFFCGLALLDDAGRETR